MCVLAGNGCSMAVELFFALLNPGDSKGGWGAYDKATGTCRYYSQGVGEWFFEMGTGRPAFYVEAGSVHWLWP